MGFFSGVRDFLFGRKPSASTSQHPTMTPEQQEALRGLLSTLTSRTSATKPYGGSLSAPIRPGIGTSLAAMEELALNPDRMGQTRDTLSRYMNKDNVNDPREYYDRAIADPAIKEFQERIMPEITGRFRGNAAFGSDRIEAERRATEDLTKTLAGRRSELEYNAREAADTRALQAAGLMPGVEQSNLQALTALLSGQLNVQGLEQQGLDRQYLEFIRQMGGEEKNIEQLLAALGLRSFENVTTTDQGSSGIIQQILQGLSQGAGAALGGRLGR